MSTFNLKIRPTKDSCEDAEYFFRTSSVQGALALGDSMLLTLVGGIGPYDWSCLTPGVSVANAQTSGLTNTVSYTDEVLNEEAFIEVTDSCGSLVTFSITLYDYDTGVCDSGTCAAAAALAISGPLTGVHAGSQFTATGGITPYRWRMSDGVIDGSGEVQSIGGVNGRSYQSTVQVIDMCGHRAELSVELALPSMTVGTWVPEVGNVVPAWGCDDDMRYYLDCGEIDKYTGEILSLDGCDCEDELTVTAHDGCGQSLDDTQPHELAEWCECDELTLSGSDEPVVGAVYTASGGQGTLTFSFDSGSISTTENTCTITAIDACGVSGSDRVGIIAVTDTCPAGHQEANIHARLPGGKWVGDGAYYIASDYWQPTGGDDPDPEERIYWYQQCCGSFDGMEMTQRVKHADGTYADALFSDGTGRRYTEVIVLGGNCNFCPGLYDSCDNCSPEDEQAIYDCMRGIAADGNENLGTVLPNASGSPAVSFVYKASDDAYGMLACYRFFSKWVCS